MNIYQVTAHYDDDTGRWTAVSDDVPGLVCEAGDMHELKQTIRDLAPMLLDLNGKPDISSASTSAHSAF